MGEPKVVAQLDLGVKSIDASKVVVPTSERIVGFTIEQTREGLWCRFEVRTTQRTISVEPGLLGKEAFDVLCGKVKAMYATAAGAEVVAAIGNIVAAKPLAITATVAEVEAIAPK